VFFSVYSLVLLATALQAQVQFDTVITVRDGARLEATIVFPPGTSPALGVPGMVLVHGYGGSKRDMESLAYSVRGQGNSTGLSTTSGEAERLDLEEVIAFFRRYPRVDGDRLGVVGGSQGGIHAWMAAVHRMPGIMVVVPLIATPHFAGDLVPGGCIKRGLVEEITLGSVRYDTIRETAKDFIIRDLYDSLVIFTGERDLEHLLDSVQVPVIQGLGWADALFPANAGIRAAARLSGRGIPIWSYYGTNGHGEPTNMSESAFLIARIIEWCNHWLKGVTLDRANIPLVFYADDRPNWPHHVVSEWPPKPEGTLRLYLTADGLSTSLPSVPGRLPFSLEYDVSYTPLAGWDDRYTGPQFQQAFESLPVYLMSPPLLDTVEVTGIPRAHIVVEGDKPEFQSHIRLFDLQPADTGYVWNLMTRGPAGNRGSTPHFAQEIDVECHALSHIVPPGHRIGVEITSLDMLSQDEAYIIPYFLSTHSYVLTSDVRPSYVDVPLVGTANIVGFQESAIASRRESILFPNYPNPFNLSTTIRFSLARHTQTRLVVFNALGQSVATLVDGPTGPGEYTLRFDGDRLASGVYFCQLSAGSETSVRKILLLR
jgi:predicted acyl esterase